MSDYFREDQVRSANGFYLVQRLKYQPWDDKTKAFYNRPGVKINSNPFGYGRLGHFELDYMGSAEFEFGAIPAAYKRFEGQELELASEIEIPGIFKPLDFLYMKRDGEPYTAFEDWCKGSEHRDSLRGKERPYDFEKKAGVNQFAEDYEFGGDLWWALGANVIWGITEGEKGDEGMLFSFLRGLQMKDAPRELRGAPR